MSIEMTGICERQCIYGCNYKDSRLPEYPYTIFSNDGKYFFKIGKSGKLNRIKFLPTTGYNVSYGYGKESRIFLIITNTIKKEV